MEIIVCAWVYFLKSAGFSRTSSGEIFSSPTDASTFVCAENTIVQLKEFFL